MNTNPVTIHASCTVAGCNCNGWELSPYNYPPMESDVCECDSRFCVDCSPVVDSGFRYSVADYDRMLAKLDEIEARPSLSDRLWLTFYKLKRWIEVQLPSNG